MNNRSRKNKGDRFENYLVEIFRENLDKDTSRNYASGAGLDKNDFRCPNIGIEVEAKNSKRFGLKKGLEQIERQRTKGNTPILIMRHPDYAEFKKSVVALDLDDFIEIMLKGKNVEVAYELPDNLKWKVKKLKEDADKVFKELNKFDTK